MLAGKQLFFTAAGNNRRIAAEAGKRFGLRWQELAHSGIERRLRGVRGKALLLWGDGGEHHLSYYFERRAGFGLKIGVDAHLDMGCGERPDCMNHFALSAEGNHDVVVHVPHWRGWQAEGLCGAGRQYSHSHISIDFDFIKGFPCAERFSCGSGSLSALLEVVGMSVGEGLLRVDMGGLKARPTEAEFQRGLEACLAVLELLERKW